MRLLAFILALLVNSLSFADDIKCYTNEKMVYHHSVHDISFIDQVLVFFEDKTEKAVITNMNCLVKINPE